MGLDATAIVAILTGFGAMFAALYKMLKEMNDIEKQDLLDSNAYVKNEIVWIRQQVEELRTELEVVRRERDEARARVIELESRVNAMQVQLNQYQSGSGRRNSVE